MTEVASLNHPCVPGKPAATVGSAPSPEQVRALPAAPGPVDEHATVLLVDDDPSMLRLLAAHVGAAGYPVITENDGEAGLRTIQEKGITLVISDWEMPGLSGLELCRRIRADSSGGYVYTLIVTGHGGKESVIQALEAGADDYLTKPFHHSELVARLRAGERMIRLEADLTRTNRALEARIDAHRRTEERLRLHSAALRSAANAIVITDCEGRIVWTNPAFTRLTGYTEAEAIGQYPRVLKSGRQDRPFYEEMWNTVLAGKTWRGELINRRKDGSLYTEDMTITPVLDDAGNVTNFVAIKQDISEQKAAETQRIRSMALESERNHLRDAVKAHERVLGVVGHELRTPLAGIRAMSEFLLLDDVRESEEFDVFVRSINDELARMANLVNDLVEVSRLNSGTANWNWGEVNVHEVCHEALDGVRTLVDHARVRLSLQVDPPHLMMSGDAGGIRRLLVNLLSNAHKNTSQGSISLRARRIERGGRSWLELTITDTGSGMTPEVAKRLGEAFALNSGVVGESHVKGSGLGLAICKGIVAAHGGTIHVATAVGKGTMLTVLLRMDLDQPEAVGQAAAIVAEVTA